MNLRELASRAIEQAKSRGATGAEFSIAEGNEFSAGVRMGEIETLTEAGSRSAGIRVLRGHRVGSSYTSDLTPEGIAQMLDAAFQISEITSEDPFAGLPDAADLGQLEGDLKIHADDVEQLPATRKIAMAKAAEAASLSFDPRISNSKGASFDTYTAHYVFANSLGFLGEYRTSSCSIRTSPVARDNGNMERDYWYSSGRSAAELEDPEEVGRKAAQRVLRRLGARKVDTQRVPVIFEPRIAGSILDHLFDAVDGRSIYRQSSFLEGKLGQKIAPETLTIIDDATMPGRFGTCPFDDEGVTSRRTVVVEKGVLKAYLLNSYAARRLGMKTTGNASRGVTGNAGIYHGNLYIENGVQNPEEMIRGVKNGFYVTELIGSGVNTVTGDYSRGAAGIWIRDGELAFPVSEVTIASTLQEMFLGIRGIGGDLQFRSSLESPTLMFGEMTVGGK